MLLSGDRLQLLRDNPSLVKPTYLAADPELLIEGERFDQCSLLCIAVCSCFTRKIGIYCFHGSSRKTILAAASIGRCSASAG
jgi:hypothetical protein